MRVGELARAAGLTVRTLHYYDEIGLLTPSERSGGGHRLYTAADVQRLYRICLLRRLGVPLEQITPALDDPAWSLVAAMSRHLQHVDRQLALGHQLRARLSGMVAALSADNPPSAQDLLTTVEEMAMLDSAVQRRIVFLVYADIEAAHHHLVSVCGLGAGRIERDDNGIAVHGEVQAGDGVIWLHRVSPRFGLASPQSAGVTTAGVAVMVDDVDAHHAHAAAAGARIVYPPTDMPYGVREYGARDAEGGWWSFMTALD
jgi:MerR family transcriptional regulator, thiopeptide resistance regulator